MRALFFRMARGLAFGDPASHARLVAAQPAMLPRQPHEPGKAGHVLRCRQRAQAQQQLRRRQRIAGGVVAGDDVDVESASSQSSRLRLPRRWPSGTSAAASCARSSQRGSGNGTPAARAHCANATRSNSQ